MPLLDTTGNDSTDAYGGGVAAVPNYIENVFSTWLTTGTGASQSIVNGIDLAGKGGMVWVKNRNDTNPYVLYDTVRGAGYKIISNLTNAQSYNADTITSFNSNGFSLGADANGFVNYPAYLYANWTFRKQPKFFDVQTFTTNGSGGATFSHNLNSTPGAIIFKEYSGADSWYVWHTSLGNSQYLVLNNTSPQASATNWCVPTSTNVTISSAGLNPSQSYVAYIYASNAGGFGLTGTDNVITCGSYTEPASGSINVNLGYEPQWLMVKRADSTSNWYIMDNMRGWPVSSGDSHLYPNLTNAEATGGSAYWPPNATGFSPQAGILGSGATVIYIAIRRGPMAVPTTGTSVFSPNIAVPQASPGNVVTTGFPEDLLILAQRDKSAISNTYVADRLRGSSSSAFQRLGTNQTGAEANVTNGGFAFDSNTSIQDNYMNPVWGVNTSTIYWNFKRAPSFFDEVCYTGTGSTNYAVTHNLGVAPELMIIRFRNLADNWYVYSKAAGGAGTYLILNNSNAIATGVTNRFPTDPTSTQFYVGNALNASSYNNVAYLFATCPGVSKVGAYTGNGTSQAISCGFTGGARFVLIKQTDSSGDWYVYDTARGMTTLTDPYLTLDTTNAESATLGSVTSTTGGFTVNASILAAINTSGASYIFLAIS